MNFPGLFISSFLFFIIRKFSIYQHFLTFQQAHISRRGNSLRTSENNGRIVTCIHSLLPRIVDHMTSSLSDTQTHKLFERLDLGIFELVKHLSELNVSFLTFCAFQSSLFILPDVIFTPERNCFSSINYSFFFYYISVY